jgi:hypothetical protein
MFGMARASKSVNINAAGDPINSPIEAIVTASLTINLRSAEGDAPSDARKPNSRVRRETA